MNSDFCQLKGITQTVSEKDTKELIQIFARVGPNGGGLDEILLDALCRLVGADGWARSVYPKSSKAASQHQVRYQLEGEARNKLILNLKEDFVTDCSSSFISAIGGQRRLACGSISWIKLLRRPFRSKFSDRERQLAGIVLEEVSWIYGCQEEEANRQLPVLSPSLDATFQQLLAGHCRKQIALNLGLSSYTIADYTKEIYRRLGASSQIELMQKYSLTRPNAP